MNKQIFKQLKKYRDDRGIDQAGDIITNNYEEMKELSSAIYASDEAEIIDAYCDLSVYGINHLELIGAGVNDIGDMTESIKNMCGSHDPKVTLKICNDMISVLLTSPIERESIDAVIHIIRTCYASIWAMGYNADDCMLETCKEINSRPGAFDEARGKWCKFKTEWAKALWYKADYKACKL